MSTGMKQPNKRVSIRDLGNEYDPDFFRRSARKKALKQQALLWGYDK
jgi:hypothetical protein